MKYKKINCKIIYFTFLMFCVLISFTGCGKVKNENQIKKYLKNKYGIEVEILSSTGDEDKMEYEVNEKTRDVKFDCISSMRPIIVDGSEFGTSENTNDNYYTCLTKSINKKLLDIAEKYDVKLEENYDGLIAVIEVETEEINFDKTLNIANEIMAAYDLKKEPIIRGMTHSIYISLNGETTQYYYKFTANGNKTSLGNSTSDFLDTWNIPESLEKDALNYVNSLYSGECYIVETSAIHGYRSDDGCNYVSYIIKNDNERVKKEFRFNIDRYREDLETKTLKSMEEYRKDGIEYIYE